MLNETRRNELALDENASFELVAEISQDVLMKGGDLLGIARVSQDNGSLHVDMLVAGIYHTGSVEQVDDASYLLSGDGWFRVCNEKQDLLLAFSKDGLHVYKVQTPPSALSKVLASAPKDRKSCPVTRFLVSFPEGTPQWLYELVMEYATMPDLFYQAVAAGLVYRHAGAASLQEAKKLGLEKLLEQEPLDLVLRRQAQAWMASLNRECQQEIEDTAIAMAYGLEHDLDDCPTDTVVAKALLRQRDELEGVYELLHSVDLGDSLKLELDLVDELGRNSLTSLSPIENDVVLHAVSWEDPGAWWGSTL